MNTSCGSPRRYFNTFFFFLRGPGAAAKASHSWAPSPRDGGRPSSRPPRPRRRPRPWRGGYCSGGPGGRRGSSPSGPGGWSRTVPWWVLLWLLRRRRRMVVPRILGGRTAQRTCHGIPRRRVLPYSLAPPPPKFHHTPPPDRLLGR